MTQQQLEIAAQYDINYWFILHKDLCPSCGIVLKDMHPMANLYPHFTGACKLRPCATCEEEPAKIGCDLCITCDAIKTSMAWYFKPEEPQNKPGMFDTWQSTVGYMAFIAAIATVLILIAVRHWKP